MTSDGKTMKKLSKPYAFDWHRIQFEDSYHIEYSITDMCNKNCASCSHLAPLAKTPNFVTVEEFARITEIIWKLIPDAHTFWLTGGEPTLHPEFLRLLKIARDTFTDSYIGIYSNGITLREYEDNPQFWDFTRDNGIVWGITFYDTDCGYYRNLFVRHGCTDNLAVVQGGRVFANLINYTQTPQPVSLEKYKKCGWERSKINIRNGRIYNCPSSEFADLLNDYFGKDLKVTPDDYLVVDENLTRKQIDEFRGPIPFCAQCDLDKRYKKLCKNAPSDRSIGEWSDFQ